MRLITKFSLAFAALAIMTSCSKDEDSDLNTTTDFNEAPNHFMVYVQSTEAFEKAIESAECIGVNSAYQTVLKLSNDNGQMQMKEYEFNSEKSLNIETYFEISKSDNYQVELLVNDEVVISKEVFIYGYPIKDDKIREKQKDHLELTMELDKVHSPC